MYPILLKIGPVCIHSYGLMLALAFFTGVFLAQRKAKEAAIALYVIGTSALLMLFSGIIGARLLYIAINIGYYINNPLEILMLQHGGLAFYGGAATALMAEIIYLRKKRLPVYKVGDLIIPYVALGQAIGRIGCFLNGCCFGKPTDFYFSVIFPGTAHTVHPTQIYSSLFLLILYVFLRLLQQLKLKEGIVLLSYGLLYSTFRFLIEFLRGDNTILLFGLTFSQIASIIIFIICLILCKNKL